HILVQLTEECGLDSYAAMAGMRYQYLHKLCQHAVVKPQDNKLFKRSQKIDSVLTGRWTAIPIFVTVMSLIIWLSIDVIGAPLQTLLKEGITQLGLWCDSAMSGWQVNETVRSLVVDAIFGGVGSVLSFIPIILLLFFFLSILEDSGYMSRVAFVTDRLLRRLGLSGHSIVPMLIGFGCSVPAVMASRTLPSNRDRLHTVMLIPFMSCSAKIPIYAFVCHSFFPNHGGLILVALYLTGILTGVLVAWIVRLCSGRTGAAPFVMEMPNYRMPNIKNMAHLLWDKSKDFVQHAFTVIFVASIVIWFLRSFDFQFRLVADSSRSILATISGVLVPLFNPIGLGSWQVVTALISGLIAKEGVVSTLQVLGGTSLLTPISAIPMLVFCLLYTPCVATIAAIRREIGGVRTLCIVVGQCVVAWIIAWGAFAIAQLFV
ncbi:MAG: ferrous iron transport protein B, partial [Bacteroidales bacterium]|nr:ferrous iron transport protein B [Candidatus Colimorpha onthohippi]